MSYYALILIGTIAGPLLLSFDKKIHFYTYFKPMILSLLIVSTTFIFWDEYFTLNNIWGFNEKYVQGIFIGQLPIEEICFFILVPYACLFIYEVLKGYFPNFKKDFLGKILAFAITTGAILLASIYSTNWYTFSACTLAAILTVYFYFIKNVGWYNDFTFSYFVALIPFVIVNGLLTGMATPEPVVWYSSEHIIGLRIITIPFEDLFYNYDMLIGVVFFYEKFKSRFGMA